MKDERVALHHLPGRTRHMAQRMTRRPLHDVVPFAMALAVAACQNPSPAHAPAPAVASAPAPVRPPRRALPSVPAPTDSARPSEPFPMMEHVLESLDVSVKAPPTAQLRRFGRTLSLQSERCDVQIVPDPEDAELDLEVARIAQPDAYRTLREIKTMERTADGWKLVYTTTHKESGLVEVTTKYLRRVANMNVQCWERVDIARETKVSPCVEAICTSLRAVAGGTAETTRYPSGAPALSIASGGGFSGMPGPGVDVWNDGTIHFHGDGCRKWRGGLTQVDPKRVADLLGVIKRTGFASLPERYSPRGSDCGGVTLAVRTGDQVKSSTSDLCGSIPEPLGTLIRKVGTAVGDNPCR